MNLNVNKKNKNELKYRDNLKRVLLFQNDSIWQLIIKRSMELTLNNVFIQVCTSAEDAIDQLKMDHRFDLIIADHLLEGSKTGLDLWDHLVEIKNRTPCVIISGITRSDFYFRIMPYRREMVPLFLEKVPSVNELKEKIIEIKSLIK